MSGIFQEDIDQIAALPQIPWGDMRRAVVLVTGATGLVGRALVFVLSAASRIHGLGLQIITHGGNAAKGAVLPKEPGVQFFSGDLRQRDALTGMPDRVDYIFHCAAVTRSSDMAARPAEVITTAVNSTENVLEMAREKRSRGMVYLSSMEVYGQLEAPEAKESDLGYLDLTKPRSCYPESKRLCEALCAGYWAQYEVPVVAARLAQTFGAGTPRDDPRVFAQFARSAMAGEDIVLHTEGKSRGNYCYTADTVYALLLLLLRGKPGQAYNVANPAASMTVREMAEQVAASTGGGKIRVDVRIPPDVAALGYAPYSGYRMNIDKITGLGWAPRYALDEMYSRMIADWEETSRRK